MDKSFTRPGTPLADLEAAWPDRLAEAESLLREGRNAWAIVTAIYALEIRLKVIICKRLDVSRLPQAFEVHNLNALLLVAGLSRRIEKRSARAVKKSWDKITDQAKVANEMRYTPDARWANLEAAATLKLLNDSKIGVLPWLSKQR